MVRLRSGCRPIVERNNTAKLQHALKRKKMNQDFSRRQNVERHRSVVFSSTSIRRLRLHLEYYFEDPATNRLLYNLIRNNMNEEDIDTIGCSIELSHIAQIGRVGSLFNQTCGYDQASMVELAHTAIAGSDNLRGVVTLHTNVTGDMTRWSNLSESSKCSVDLQNTFLVLSKRRVPFIREWHTVKNVDFDPRALVPPAECLGARFIEQAPALPEDILLLMQYNMALSESLEAESMHDPIQYHVGPKNKQTSRVGRLRREIAFHHCDVVFLQHAEKYVNTSILPALLQSVRKADSCDVTAHEGAGDKCSNAAVLWNAKKLERVGEYMHYDDFGAGKTDSDPTPFIALGLRRRNKDDVICAVSGYVDHRVSLAEVSAFIEESLSCLAYRANVPKDSIQLVMGISSASSIENFPDNVTSLYRTILPDSVGEGRDHLLLKGTSMKAEAVLQTPQVPRGERVCHLGAVRWSFGAFLLPEKAFLADEK